MYVFYWEFDRQAEGLTRMIHGNDMINHENAANLILSWQRIINFGGENDKDTCSRG